MSHFATIITTWGAGDWVAFIGSIMVVAGVFFPALMKLTGNYYDWLGLIRIRRQQADMADHQRTLAGAIDGPLSDRVANAMQQGLTAYAAHGDAALAGQAARAAMAASISPEVQAISAQAPGQPARSLPPNGGKPS